jgi:hypothetical protein
MAASRRRDQGGQATIEMIGIIPIAALVAGAIIQLYLVGYAAVAAESASRLAAREASKGMSHGAAESVGRGDVAAIFTPVVEVRSGNLSTSGEEPSVDPRSVGDAVSARATLTVPFLGIGVKGLNYQVTRYTVMPATD